MSDGALLREAEELKAERNRTSEAIGQAKRRGEDASAEMARMREVGDRIKALDAELATLDERIEELLAQLPNLPHPSVPEGKATTTTSRCAAGAPRAQFAFTPKPHEEVGAALGLLDIERAVKIAKARFAVMWGPLARLSRALAQFMLDLHTREHGYTELWLPHLVSGDTMLRDRPAPQVRGRPLQDRRGRRQPHALPDPHRRGAADARCTAARSCPSGSLPLRYTAFTPCYRREAGTYGKDMKGIYRQHQFDKVELVKIATPSSRTTSWSRWWARPRRSCGGSICRIAWSSAARATSASARPRATTSRCGCRAGAVPRDLVLLELRRLRRPARGSPLSAGGRWPA